MKEVSNAREYNPNLRVVTKNDTLIDNSMFNTDPLGSMKALQPEVYRVKEPVIPKHLKRVQEAPRAASPPPVAPAAENVEKEASSEPEKVKEETAVTEESPAVEDPSSTNPVEKREVVKEAAAVVRERRREVKQVKPPRVVPDTEREMPLGEWLSYTRPYHLTVGDINNLRKGDVIVAVCLNDKLAQFSLNDAVNRRGTTLPPEKFLRCTHWIIYTHHRDYAGKATWYTQDNRTGQIRYFNVDAPFEFHVEYERDAWFPLTRGSISRQSFLQEHSEFPEDFEMTSETRVGFRGPMIIMQYLSRCPKITRK